MSNAAPTRFRLIKTALLVLVYFAITLLIPRPPSVAESGWRLFGIFAATVAGLLLQPYPGGAIVLIAVILSAMFGGLTVTQALSGYGDSVVWLVLAAFFISTALIQTGLARRIALIFVRIIGQSSLGVCYALALTDMALATIIPSNGARSGGVVLPIARSIAEVFESRPGPTAARLGSFLMLGVSQSICVTAAMFLTGQASNPLAARIATETLHYAVDWRSWFVAALAPGLVSLALVPLIVMRLHPPEIMRTPEAATFARRELAAMGKMNRGQIIAAVVFLGVCTLWISTKLDIALPALLGATVLLLSGALKWEDVIGDRIAWDIFVWYGGLLMLSKALNEGGVTRAFAAAVGGWFGGAGWVTLLVLTLLVYFYAHYAFASITAHILAMFPAFGAMLIGAGAPVGLTVFSLACLANLSACLTHYGTTPLPMFYAQNYVGFGIWWKTGAVMSVVHLLVWGTIGVAWWKWIGVW